MDPAPLNDDCAKTATQGFSRRHVTAGALATAGVWVAPSVLKLDRVAAAVPSQPYIPFYTEDFQGAIGAPGATWSMVPTDVAPADPNRRFLGQFNNDTVTLSISGLPPHDCLCVEFDFYAIQSWDGNNPGTGPDRLNVLIDGVNEFSETFAHPGQTAGQTFGPDPTFNPAQTGAVETGTLGYSFFSDSVYRLSICDLVHTSSTATITFSVAGLQGINDESWGLDNLEVSYV